MRWKPHVRFGERAGETDRSKDRHRAPARLHLGFAAVDDVRRRIQRENSSGVFATTSNPCLPSASRVSAVCIPRIVSALSRPTTSFGVPAGASRPIHASDSSWG